MGMLPSHIAILAKEQKKHPIKGSVLTLGQQSVYATLDEVKKIIQSQGVTLSALADDFDLSSRTHKGSALWSTRTNAQTVLSLLGAKDVFVADCSNYESPDYLIDLNLPVSNEYFEKFDVILDIGTLEHVFNLPMLLRNLNFMLKKGGEIILMNPTSNAIDHGFYSISPTLFFDYFAANNHENFSCYLCEENPKMLFLDFPPEKVDIYRYSHVGDQFCLSSRHAVETIFFATKSLNAESINIKTPSQSLYTRLPDWQNEIGNVDNERNRKINVVSDKFKLLLKHIFAKARAFIPSDFLSKILVMYVTFQRKKKLSNNLTYIGSVTTKSNTVTLDSFTTIKLERE
jgi:SAM-dependent methyltransferase